MAYFSNSTEGDCFEYQCSLCKYGQESCPIFLAQFIYNYDACNNEVARKILDSLVSDKGECSMYKEFEKDFKIKEVVKETTLFDEIFGKDDKPISKKELNDLNNMFNYG